MLYDTSRSRRVHICGALRSRAKALHPDVRNTPDPLYISYIDFSISDTYSEFTKGMEPRLEESTLLGDSDSAEIIDATHFLAYFSVCIDCYTRQMYIHGHLVHIRPLPSLSTFPCPCNSHRHRQSEKRRPNYENQSKFHLFSIDMGESI